MSVMYVVFKQGVYRHETQGLFTLLSDAIDRARKCAKEDRDSYHSYEVFPLTINPRVGEKVELESVFATNKDDEMGKT